MTCIFYESHESKSSLESAVHESKSSTKSLFMRLKCDSSPSRRLEFPSLLRWHDRSEILKGARQAYPVKCTQDNATLLFFPDFSPAIAAKRKSLVPVLRSMTTLGLQPFLAYLVVIKLRHGGEQRSFDSLRKAEDFVSSLSQKRAFAVAPQGNRKVAATFSSARREGLDGRDRGDAGCPEEDGGARDMGAC